MSFDNFSEAPLTVLTAAMLTICVAGLTLFFNMLVILRNPVTTSQLTVSIIAVVVAAFVLVTIGMAVEGYNWARRMVMVMLVVLSTLHLRGVITGRQIPATSVFTSIEQDLIPKEAIPAILVIISLFCFVFLFLGRGAYREHRAEADDDESAAWVGVSSRRPPGRRR